jgi:hypothetical protein
LKNSPRYHGHDACVRRQRSVTADTTSRRAPMLIFPTIDDTEPIR